jgi:two-component system sensor histidine kinase PhoQ
MSETGSPRVSGRVSGRAAGPRRPASLRLRLTLLASLTLVISLGAVGVALDAAYQRSAQVGLQQQMETWAYSLMAAMEVDPDGEIRLGVAPADPLLLQPDSGVYGVIQGLRDSWKSPSVLGVTLPEVPAEPAGMTRFQAPDDSPFFQITFGLDWQLPDDQVEPVTVAVLVDRERLAPALASFRTGLWQSLGAAALLLALAQLLFSAISLRPLKKVALDVANVEAGRTSRLAGPYPRELEPLTRNVDHLLASEQANQARYRDALDSLAHSLKTPLAVLKANPDSDPARRQALSDMELLIATRLERAAAGTRRALAAPLPVAPVVERLAASLRKVHSQDLRNLQCIMEPGLVFFGEERDLMELAGNLLDNACKYGAGQVRLEARAVGAGPRPGLELIVGNDGQPVSLEGLVQRGLRGDERAVEGHGLGLNIVAEIASAYGGRLSFGQSPLGGAEVSVIIPAGHLAIGDSN